MAGICHGNGVTGLVSLQVNTPIQVYGSMVAFRVPSRESLGWGGQPDSPPVYVLIHHRKASVQDPVHHTRRHARVGMLWQRLGGHK